MKVEQKLAPTAYVKTRHLGAFVCTFCGRPLKAQKGQCDCEGYLAYKEEESRLKRHGDDQAYFASHCSVFVARVSRRETVTFRSYLDYSSFVSDPQFRVSYYRRLAIEREKEMTSANERYRVQRLLLEEERFRSYKAKAELKAKTLENLTIEDVLQCGLTTAESLSDAIGETAMYNNALSVEEVLTFAMKNLNALMKKEMDRA